VQLYARAAADAVLEGKAAAPNSASVREEEFVELGADGKPANKGPRGRAPAKKAAAPAGEGLARAEAEVAENEAADKEAAE
jgi:small subunit ribosomal protein S2